MALDLTTIESLLEPICVARGLELVEVRFLRDPSGPVLRISVDRERDPSLPLNQSGVSVDDCKEVSREASEALDAQDLIPGAYNLEVSSPGIERPLVKLRDFDRFKGLEAKIATHAPGGYGRKTFQGILDGVEGQNVLLHDDKEAFSIGFGDIVKAHLVHRWNAKPGKRQSAKS